MRYLCPLLLVVLSTGCFHTRVRSGAPIRGPVHETRQWFALFGAIPLSSDAGGECSTGLAYADSRLGGTDILIQVGLTVGAGIVAVAACPLPDNPSDSEVRSFANCTTAIGLAANLIGSRTVSYQCLSGSGDDGE